MCFLKFSSSQCQHCHLFASFFMDAIKCNIKRIWNMISILMLASSQSWSKCRDLWPAATQQALKPCTKNNWCFFLSVEKKRKKKKHSTGDPAPGGPGEEKPSVWNNAWMWLTCDWTQVKKSKPKRLKTADVSMRPEALVYLSLVSLEAPPPGSLCSFSSCTSSPFWAGLETHWPNWWPSRLS